MSAKQPYSEYTEPILICSPGLSSTVKSAIARPAEPVCVVITSCKHTWLHPILLGTTNDFAERFAHVRTQSHTYADTRCFIYASIFNESTSDSFLAARNLACNGVFAFSPGRPSLSIQLSVSRLNSKVSPCRVLPIAAEPQTYCQLGLSERIRSLRSGLCGRPVRQTRSRWQHSARQCRISYQGVASTEDRVGALYTDIAVQQED